MWISCKLQYKYNQNIFAIKYKAEQAEREEDDKMMLTTHTHRYNERWHNINKFLFA